MTPDDRPDRHLQAALRHAPDAGVQAPDALRDSIVAAARAALAADRAALAPKKRWWQGLWPTTPAGLGASGAFATLALGGVIALLWHDEPPPPPVAPPAEFQRSIPVPAAPAALQPDATSATPSLQVEERRESTAKAAPARLREAALPRVAAEARKAAANDVAAAAPPVPAPETAAAPAAAAPAAKAKDAAEAPATVPTALPTAPATTAAPASPAAPAAPVATASLEAVSPARTPAPARLEASRLAAGPAGAALGRASGTLQIAPGAGTPVSAEDTRWLAEVRRIAQGRWQASSATAIPGGRERRVGAVRVVVGSGRLLWCEAGPPAACTEAALEAEEESRLLGSMPR